MSSNLNLTKIFFYFICKWTVIFLCQSFKGHLKWENMNRNVREAGKICLICAKGIIWKSFSFLCWKFDDMAFSWLNIIIWNLSSTHIVSNVYRARWQDAGQENNRGHQVDAKHLLLSFPVWHPEIASGTFTFKVNF